METRGQAMRVAPTEPVALKRLGVVSALPEIRGVDFLWAARGKWWGVQRKELRDLLASLEDGRLAKEVGQMNRVDVAMVIVEGTPRFTTDGNLIDSYNNRWTRQQILGALWSVRLAGVWVEWSRDLTDTARMLEWFHAWSVKEHHLTGRGRPGPGTASPWGRADNRDWCLWVLQGFQGVGPELAERIVQTFGCVPLGWTVTEAELRTVDGIGVKKARALWEALNHAG